MVFFFFFKQKTAYELRISDWSSDVCSSDLLCRARKVARIGHQFGAAHHQHRRQFLTPGIEQRHRLFALAVAVECFDQRRPHRPVFIVQPIGSAREQQGQLRTAVRHPRETVGQYAEPLRHARADRSEEHTSELQSLMRTSYAVFCLKKKNKKMKK